jgi:hypothetical protein
MPPFTVHEWSLNGLMSVKTVQTICHGHLSHLWEILEGRMRQRFSPTSTKHQIIEFLMKEWCRIPPIVEPMPRHIEAVLVDRGGPTPLRHFMLVLPLFWHLPVYIQYR